MYVIAETGGRQYKLEKNGEFTVNRVPGKQAATVKLKHILFAKERNTYHIGAPYLKDACVTCEIVSHLRGKKVFAFKYKKRKSQKSKVGHRQDLTRLRVKEITI
jgi:large subunit ribosomal protein L21